MWKSTKCKVVLYSEPKPMATELVYLSLSSTRKDLTQVQWQVQWLKSQLKEGVKRGGGRAWDKTRTLLNYAMISSPIQSQEHFGFEFFLDLELAMQLVYLSLSPTRQDLTYDQWLEGWIIAWIKWGWGRAWALDWALLDYAGHWLI